MGQSSIRLLLSAAPVTIFVITMAKFKVLQRKNEIFQMNVIEWLHFLPHKMACLKLYRPNYTKLERESPWKNQLFQMRTWCSDSEGVRTTGLFPAAGKLCPQTTPHCVEICSFVLAQFGFSGTNRRQLLHFLFSSFIPIACACCRLGSEPRVKHHTYQ